MLMLYVVLLLTLSASLTESSCYENWSRCTPQTSAGTGILWKSCAEYCQKCKGRSSGACEKVFNRECSGGYQCKCNGGSTPKSENPVDKMTCAMGL